MGLHYRSPISYKGEKHAHPRWPVAGHLWYLSTLMAAYIFITVLAGFFRSRPLRL